MLTLDNFDTEIDKTIVQRGLAYFKKNAVESLDEDAAGTWQGVVSGTAYYEIEIDLSGKKVSATSCDCPYEDGPVCKHIVAVLFALREQTDMVLPKKKSTKGKKPAKLNFEGILAKVKLEELRDFIRQQKKDSRDFGDKFMLYFADKDPQIDVLKKYQGLVQQLIRANSNRGFMDYRQTYAFSKAIQPIFSAANTAIDKKNYRDAFAIAKVLYEETLQLVMYCDDSSGNIGGMVSSSVAIFGAIARVKEASPELQDQLLAYVLKSLSSTTTDVFNYGDSGYELLGVVKEIARRTDPAIYLNLLDTLVKVHVGKYSNYKQEYFKKAKIRFLESLGRTAEVEKLVAENLDIVEVRRAEVQKAVDKKAFAQAKQLIADGIKIAEDKKNPGTVTQWEETLLAIAQLEEDVDTIRYFSKKFAFQRHFSPQYYAAWKATFSAEEWPQVIAQHIEDSIAREESTPKRFGWDHKPHSLFSGLSPIFIQEEMWPQLLELVVNYPKENALLEVHDHLAIRFPNEMLDVYLQMLTKLGDDASDRKAYQYLAKWMKKVKQDIENSSTAIDQLATSLIKKYPRRIAMVEELAKVLRM